MKRSTGRKRRKIFMMLVVVVVTTVVFIVETYAWFTGISTVNTSDFNVSISTDDGLKLSLTGVSGNWNNTITINSSTYNPNGYSSNTNKWPTGGLIPLSSAFNIDTDYSRLKIFSATSLAPSPGGYKLIADRVDNYTGAEADGYIVFDLFIKNGNNGYLFDESSEEDIFLTSNSSATVNGTNYGGANSLRVGFFEIGSVSTNATISTIQGIQCNDSNTSVVNKCDLSYYAHAYGIWEPNHDIHSQRLIDYYNSICRQRNSGGYTSSPCATISTTNSYVNTYAVLRAITASENVDIYDGGTINGYTLNTAGYTGAPEPLTNNTTIKTTPASAVKYTDELLRLPGNSITKVRVYIWLEGQDIDNYDLITKDQNINIKFGLTKDRFKIGPSPSS